MSALNHHRKAVNEISTTLFVFHRYLSPDEESQPAEKAEQTTASNAADPKTKDKKRLAEKKKKLKKQKQKEAKEAKADFECHEISPELIARFLRERYKINVEEDSIELSEPIKKLGEHVVPLEIRHTEVSHVDKKYLDPEFLHHTKYEMRIKLIKADHHDPATVRQSSRSHSPEEEDELVGEAKGEGEGKGFDLDSATKSKPKASA